MNEVVTKATDALKSEKYSLNWKDAGKGLIMAVGTAAIVTLKQALSTTPVVLDLKSIGMAAASAALVYLVKNFFTDDKTTVILPPK